MNRFPCKAPSGRALACLGLLTAGAFAAMPAPVAVPVSSVRELPEVVVTRSVNLLPNPSFERGPGRSLPEYWSRFGELGQACLASRFEEGVSVDGKRCARIAAGEALRIPTEYPSLPKEDFVLSAYVRLPEGTPAGKTRCTLGLWVKVDVDDGRPKPETWEKAVVLTHDWQRVVVSAKVDRVLKYNRWGIVGALFEARISALGGDMLVDAVQLEQNTQATDFAGEPRVDLGVVPPSPEQDELALVMRALQTPPARAPATTRPGEMSLTVSSPAQASGRVFARGGVPFARGALFRGDRVRLVDANGRDVPLQTQVLARYGLDASVRSLYVVFPANASAKGAFRLRYGGKARAIPATKPRIRVAEDARGVMLTTGPLRLTMSRASFRLFDGVWLDRDKDGRFADRERVINAKGSGGCSAIDDQGQVWDSRRDRPTLVVERAGPLEAVIRVQGWHRESAGRGQLGYIVRVYAYAGSANVRIEHTFENMASPGSPSMLLRGIALDLPLQGHTGTAFGAARQILPPARSQRILQTVRDGEMQCAVTHGDGTDWRKQELDGDFSFGTPAATVSLRVEDFAASYPLAVSVEAGTASIELWPKQDVKLLALSHGLGKTHRMWLGFAPGEESPRLPTGPSRVVANPAQALKTEAFLWGVPPAQSTYPEFETALGSSMALQGAAGETIAARGKFNFGDRLSAGGFWLNSETAFARPWLLHYLRTGDRRLLNTAERAVRHTMDADMDHVTGGQYVHNIHHTLGRRTHNSHNYSEILTLYYMLTGDALALDFARRNAVACRAWVTSRHAKGRGHGWPAWHIAEMADITREKVNIDASLAIATRFRSSIKTVAGKRTSLSDKGGLLYGGTNLNALLRVHRATGNADAKAAFIDELDHTINTVRARGGWSFGGRDLMMVEPMVYGWRLTGDPKYIKLGMEALLKGAANSGARDRDLAMGAPLLAAAAQLGMSLPPALTAQRWGFKRKHTMYIMEREDGPFRASYQRVAAGGKGSEWWFKLTTPDGRLVKDEAFKATDRAEGSFEFPKDGKTGCWKLELHQGYPGMIDFAFSLPDVVLQVEAGMRRSASSPELYWFRVPKNTSGFTIAVRQYYGSGPSAVVVRSPDGAIAGEQRWTPSLAGERKWHEAQIEIPPTARAETWSVLVAVGGQFQMRMTGLPPFVAPTPEALFTPPGWKPARGR